MDRLPGDVARARVAQESNGCGDVFRLAALTGDGVMDQMMRRLRRVLGARRTDQPGNDAVDDNSVVGEVVRSADRAEVVEEFVMPELSPANDSLLPVALFKTTPLAGFPPVSG